MAIIHFLLFQCGNRTETSESDVYKRQILTHWKGLRVLNIMYPNNIDSAGASGCIDHFLKWQIHVAWMWSNVM